MQIHLTTRIVANCVGFVLLFASLAARASAQSTDVAWPTPVRANEVTGTIHARDIGDPRVTDHFYAFTGMPGDVLITVDSRNLNGDIDVFTFSGLRPLLKFTIYAGSSSPITKSIYLRQQEDLILRVEGRSPNDDDAVYRIHLGGSFSPITSGPLAEHEDATQAATAGLEPGKNGRRVSSVGARIAEQRTEVAETPTPQPAPLEPSEARPKTAAARPTAGRARRPVTRRTRPVQPPKPDESAAKIETGTPAESTETPTESTAKRDATAAGSPTRRSRAARGAARTPTAEEPEDSGPRLVIQTNDGTLVDRYMSSVRRVTVENGQVVVVGKDGKIQRIPLVSVVRMTISP
ncbi:MAG TPA: hypothetical protein VGO73_05730 [Pyrinomonadaceae bacterium]|jgi:hypothetical protein|nr:hypothetical protein [Pyrinomonadaceae bacterium]